MDDLTNPQGGERVTIWRCAGDCGTYSTDPRAISHAANCGKRFGPHERIEAVPATRLQEAEGRVEELERALRTIRGPSDSGPYITVYREAGGGYEGLQAIAKSVLPPTTSSLSGRGEVEGGSRSALPATENRGAPSLPRPESDEKQ